MPDIYCKHCGEPWDIYELHDLRDANTDKKRTFKEATALFAKFGCGTFNIFSDPSKCTNAVYDDDAAMRAFVNQELSEHADDWIE
jgi:hypothetical protein